MRLLLLEPSEPQDEPVQKTEAELWAQVEEDLNWAKDKLPEQWDDGNVGRATKGAAKALLARALMQQKKYTRGENRTRMACYRGR